MEAAPNTAQSATSDILAYAAKLPMWQQDALRRLALKSALDDGELGDLYNAAKMACGILAGEGQAPTPLAEGHLTSAGSGRPAIQLLALGGTENVNQLKPGEDLAFGPTGVTLIYGDNGSGKSGYARIFKAASAARSAEDLLPDVFDAGYADKPPAKAKFKVATPGAEGAPVEVAWEDKKPAPAILRQIRVFDKRIASLYVEEKTNITFIPFNLDLLDRLGAACIKLKERLDGEIAKLDEERATRLDGIPAGEARATAEGVTATTPAEAIEGIFVWTGADDARRSEVFQLLSDAERALKALQLRRARIDALLANLNLRDLVLSEVSVDALQGSVRRKDELRAAANALGSEAFAKDETLLPGVGGAAWKALWEAARKYSMDAAYPGLAFPVTDAKNAKEAQCVLCHEVLPLEAQERLSLFEKFVSGEVERQAVEAESSCASAITTFRGLSAMPNPNEEVLISEIEEQDASLAEKIRSHFRVTSAFQSAVLDAVLSGKPILETSPPPFDGEPLKVLAKITDAKVAEAELAITPEKRSELGREAQALDAKKSLSDNKKTLEALRVNRKKRSELAKCTASFETRSISTQKTALSEKYVTKQFEDLLRTELASLGVSRGVGLQAGTQKTTSFVKPKLAASGFSQIERVLSEGEHRALALACFLAETAMMGTRDAVVIDDPVSSLDHERMYLVARRLVAEAKSRQVVIFTHDMVFWAEVIEAAGDQDVVVATRDLMRDGKVCGVVGPGSEPWHNLDVAQRLDYIERIRLPRMRKLHEEQSPDYAEVARGTFVKLRDTWERVVEEGVFNKSVLRFRKSVKTGNLKEVAIELDDWPTVDKGVTRTSNWCHDRARGQGNASPIPQEVVDEVATIRAFLAKLKERRKDVDKARKQPKPGTP